MQNAELYWAIWEGKSPDSEPLLMESLAQIEQNMPETARDLIRDMGEKLQVSQMQSIAALAYEIYLDGRFRSHLPAYLAAYSQEVGVIIDGSALAWLESCPAENVMDLVQVLAELHIAAPVTPIASPYVGIIAIAVVVIMVCPPSGVIDCSPRASLKI